jgi:putative ABC transport system permease protein
MWLLALKAMVADRGKLLTSVLGVAFAVVLINLQVGLLRGLLRKASLLVDCGRADVWVGPRHMNNVDIGTFIPERWVQRLRGIEGVERADPYVVAFGIMKMPDGRFEDVVVVGSEPASLLGNAWVMADGDPRAVRHPDGILVDSCDAERLGDPRIGDVREINRHRAKVVGTTRGIVGFTTNPYVFTTMERARTRYAKGVPPEHCSYFLVKARPGTDVKALCARIKARVPELDVYDRPTYGLMCMEYWLTRTGIGISFGLAAFLGLLVGLAVVAQTLYASVTERVEEFGTLKALGADDRSVSRFLLAHALGNALLGGAVGLVASVVLARLVSTERAPAVLSWDVALASVAVTAVVCLAAAWAPYRRIRNIDPASVLRS